VSAFPTVETLLAACAEYRAKLTQVECENAALRVQLEDMTNQFFAVSQENAALQDDKKRLDWIQKNGPRVVNVLHHWQVWDDPEFRAIVDAARAKEGGAT
jgi:hypothetical protein